MAELTVRPALRFKADSIPGADGDLVASWPEISGNGHLPAAQPTAARQPLLRVGAVNGHRAVEFDGVDTSLLLSGTANSVLNDTGGLTVVVVWVPWTADTGMQNLLSFSHADSEFSSRFQLRTDGTARQVVMQGKRLDSEVLGTLSSAATQPLNPQYGTNHLLTATVGFAAARAFLYSNGTQVATSTAFGTAGRTAPSTPLRGVIGAHVSTNVQFLNARIAEIIVYRWVLSSSDRAAVHSYVQDEYGIQVADYLSLPGTGAEPEAIPPAGAVRAPSGRWAELAGPARVPSGAVLGGPLPVKHRVATVLGGGPHVIAELGSGEGYIARIRAITNGEVGPPSDWVQFFTVQAGTLTTESGEDLLTESGEPLLV